MDERDLKDFTPVSISIDLVIMHNTSRVKHLLAGANANDAEAVAALFNEFEKDTLSECRKALRRVGVKSKTPSDLAGSVRRKLYQGFRQHRFANVRDASAYRKLLFTCVHGASIDAFRREKAQKRGSKKVVNDEHPGAHADPSIQSVSKAAASKEFVERLKARLQPWECAMIDFILDGHSRRELPDLLAPKFGTIMRYMIGASIAKLETRISREHKHLQ